MRVVTIFLIAALSRSLYAIEDEVSRNKFGRVDYIYKEVTAANLDTGTSLTEEVKTHIKRLSAPDDVIVAILDEKIGGPGNETYNALPMNPSTREIWKTKVINVTYNYLKDHNTHRVGIMSIPFYENLSSTRPYGLAVFVLKDTLKFNSRRPYISKAFIVKTYIPNPPKSVSETISAHIDSTSNSYGLERENETFLIVGLDKSPRERIEMALKDVRLSDLTTGTDLDEVTKKHAESLAGDEPYVPGLLLSQKFGGKGNDPYNVVPMEPKAVEAFESKVEVPILKFFKAPENQDEIATINVIAMYPAHTSTRPVGFVVLSRQLLTFATYISNRYT